jgi:hypothetical protein
MEYRKMDWEGSVKFAELLATADNGIIECYNYYYYFS